MSSHQTSCGYSHKIIDMDGNEYASNGSALVMIEES